MSELDTIAVVGASARAAAFSVLRAGYRAVTADLFADVDLQKFCPATQISPYPAGLQAWLTQCECDAWLYTGALENRPELVEAMAAERRLLGNSGEVLRLCRDPRVLVECGLPLPETVASSVGLPLGSAWLCKTYRGSCGSGVWELLDEPSRQRAAEAEAVFQRRVKGQLMSAVFVLGESWQKTLGVTKQWVGETITGATKFQYAGSVGIGEANYTALEQQLDRISHLLAEQLGLRGLVGIDFMLEEDHVWLLEVNPRYTAAVEILERSTGASAIAAHVAACMGAKADDVASSLVSKQVFGKAVLYAKREVVISQELFEWMMYEAGMGLDSGAADVPATGSQIPTGRPVVTIFASGEDAADDQFLRQRVDEVESRLYGVG